MSGIRIEGNTSGNVAEVNSSNQLLVVLPTTLAEAGTAIIAGQNGDGTYTSGVPYNVNARVSPQNRLNVGVDTMEFDYNFIATAQDTGAWKFGSTTMTASQTGGFVTFNANSTATTTTGCSLQTWRTFNPITNSGMKVSFDGLLSNPIPGNEVHELGLYFATTTTGPADGVYFRLTSAGIIGVINYNGTETATTFSASAASTYLVATNSFTLSFVVYAGQVDFFIAGIYLGTIPIPQGNAYAFLTGALPVCVQQRNSGVVSGPQQYKLGRVHVTQTDIDLSLPFSHQMAAEGGMASQAMQGSTMGSTALYTNSLASGSAGTMTNTTAGLGSGLGGQFTGLATLAAGTDGIVCSYQNPAGSVTIEPRILMITGIKIMSVVAQSFTGPNAAIFAYSLAYGHTAVSMAQAESATFATPGTGVKAPRRVPLGLESFIATATPGTMSSPQGIYMPFNSPIAVNPSEFVAICAKSLGGTMTAGALTWLITFDGYWI